MIFFLCPNTTDFFFKFEEKFTKIGKGQSSYHKRVNSKTLFHSKQKKNISKPGTIFQQSSYGYNDQNKKPWELEDVKYF